MFEIVKIADGLMDNQENINLDVFRTLVLD